MPRFTIVGLLAITAFVSFAAALAVNEPALLIFMGTLALGAIATFVALYLLYPSESGEPQESSPPSDRVDSD